MWLAQYLALSLDVVIASYYYYFKREKILLGVDLEERTRMAKESGPLEGGPLLWKVSLSLDANKYTQVLKREALRSLGLFWLEWAGPIVRFHNVIGKVRDKLLKWEPGKLIVKENRNTEGQSKTAKMVNNFVFFLWKQLIKLPTD